MQLTPDRTLSFSIFEKYPQLLCTMSTRLTGNLWIKDKLSRDVKSFLGILGLGLDQFIAMDQVHGNKVEIVKPLSAGSIGVIFKGVDGLVTASKKLYIGVNVADCVPLYFFDPKRQNIAAVHAGWKGILGNIVRNTVSKLKSIGSNPDDTLVVVGPHIGGCCYDVDPQRAGRFQSVFDDVNIVFQNKNRWYLDLGRAIYQQLLDCGISSSHLEAPIVCTSCQNDRYFSFRKDNKETFGEMLGIIGIRN